MSRDRKIISITVDKELYEKLKKLRSHGINVSRFVENAIKQYLSSYTGKNDISQSENSSNTVIIERDLYFNNVCRSLLNTYNPSEIRRLRIGTEYSNALGLIYHICKQALSTPAPTISEGESNDGEAEEVDT